MDTLRELYGHKETILQHKDIVKYSTYYDSERKKRKISALDKLESDIDDKISKRLSMKETITNRIIEIKLQQDEFEGFSREWHGMQGGINELERILNKI